MFTLRLVLIIANALCLVAILTALGQQRVTLEPWATWVFLVYLALNLIYLVLHTVANFPPHQSLVRRQGK